MLTADTFHATGSAQDIEETKETIKALVDNDPPRAPRFLFIYF
jgi:hypothetical protein